MEKKSIFEIQNFAIDISKSLAKTNLYKTYAAKQKVYEEVPTKSKENSFYESHPSKAEKIRPCIVKIYSAETVGRYYGDFLQMLKNWEAVLDNDSPFPQSPTLVWTLNYAYVFTPLIQGKPFKEFLAKRKDLKTISIVLNKLIKVLTFLNEHKLVHRKLDLSHVLVDKAENGEFKVFITGIKYLKSFGATYLESESWLNLSEKIKKEQILNEKTNMLSFGELLEELCRMLDKDLFETFVSKLEDIKIKCLKENQSERPDLKILTEEIAILDKEKRDFYDFYELRKCPEERWFSKKHEIEVVVKKIPYEANPDQNQELERLKYLASNTDSQFAFWLKDFFQVKEESKEASWYYYLVEKKLDGIPLKNYTISRENGHLPLCKALPILRAIGRAIKQMHDENVAHRGFRPESIYIHEDEYEVKRAYVTNPGSYRKYIEKIEDDFPPELVAPELSFKETCCGLINASENDKKADIYSFAKLAHYIIFGKFEVPSGTAPEITETPEWKEMCEHTLTPDPKARWNIDDLLYCKFMEPDKDLYNSYVKETEKCEGGCAKVYTCIRQSDKKKFAMKKYKNTTKRTHIEQEIVTAKKLDSASEYIVMYENSYQYEDVFYLIMEKMEGDLYRYLNKTKKGLTEKEVKLVAFSIAKALEYMHSLGECHTDVKTANLMILSLNGKLDKVKLGDFGKTYGTKYYMSEKAAEEINNNNPQADMWGYGVTLLEVAMGDLSCISGKKRIKEDYSEVINRLVREKKLNEDLGNLIKTCFESTTGDFTELLRHKYFSIQ